MSIFCSGGHFYQPCNYFRNFGKGPYEEHMRNYFENGTLAAEEMSFKSFLFLFLELWSPFCSAKQTI